MSREANLAVLQDFFRERFEIELSDRAIESLVLLIRRIGNNDGVIVSLTDFLVSLENAMGCIPEAFRARVRGGYQMDQDTFAMDARVHVCYSDANPTRGPKGSPLFRPQ
jgi:hypothetical protein